MPVLIEKTAFGMMRLGFAQAKAYSRDLYESHYILAGQAVQFRIVGRELAEQIHQTFAHLAIDRSVVQAAGLTVEMWDEGETGVSRPRPCAPKDVSIGARSNSDEIVAYDVHHTLVYFDRRNEHMIGCVSGAGELSLYERGRPLHQPLTLWHNDRDVPVIHAGLVSLHGKGVLLAGGAEAGKSTSAITCLGGGFGYLSDDLTGLQASSDGRFLGHSLYNSTYFEVDHLARLPHLKQYAIKGTYPSEDKCLILLSQIWPSRLQRATGIHIIVLPCVTYGPRSRLRPASKGKALIALVPSTRKVNKSLGVRGFNKLAQLVDQVPCYWLELGRDLSDVPYSIEKCLAEIS